MSSDVERKNAAAQKQALAAVDAHLREVLKRMESMQATIAQQGQRLDVLEQAERVCLAASRGSGPTVR